MLGQAEVELAPLLAQAEVRKRVMVAWEGLQKPSTKRAREEQAQMAAQGSAHVPWIEVTVRLRQPLDAKQTQTVVTRTLVVGPFPPRVQAPVPAPQAAPAAPTQAQAQAPAPAQAQAQAHATQPQQGQNLASVQAQAQALAAAQAQVEAQAQQLAQARAQMEAQARALEQAQAQVQLAHTPAAAADPRGSIR